MTTCEAGDSRPQYPVEFFGTGYIDGDPVPPDPVSDRVELQYLSGEADCGSLKHAALQRTTSKCNGSVQPLVDGESHRGRDGRGGRAAKRVNDHAARYPTIAKPGERTTRGRG